MLGGSNRYLGIYLLLRFTPNPPPPPVLGDWFNRLDFSCETHNFGVGLPPSTKNLAEWPMFKPLLADAENLRPSPETIGAHRDAFFELLAIRYSSPLFRLPSAEVRN